jgi:hypothetical protein
MKNKYIKQFNLIESAYTGEKVSGYIVPFDATSTSELQKKKLNAYYLNYFQDLISATVIPVFSEAPVREFNNDIIGGFLANCDNKGTSLTEFMYEAVTEFKKTDQAFIVFSNFADAPKDYSDILDQRAYPYAALRKSFELFKYETNDFGGLTEISFCNGEETVTVNGSKSKKVTYTKYTKTESVKCLADRKGVLKAIEAPKLHGLDVVPVIPMNIDINPYPKAYDAATTNIAIYNQCTEQRNFERAAATITWDIPSDEPQDDVEMGYNNILWTPTNATRSASVISPDPSILEVLMKSATNTTDAMIKQADVLGATVGSTTNSSGLALGFRFLGKSFNLKRLSMVADKTDASVINMLSMFFRGTSLDWNYEVAYTKDFAPTMADISAKIDVYTKLLASDLPDETKEKLRAALDAYLVDVGLLAVE